MRRDLADLNERMDNMAQTQAQLAATIDAMNNQLVKIGTESATSVQMIADLKAIIAAGADVTPELQAAVDRLAAQIQKVDDMVPDVPPAP